MPKYLIAASYTGESLQGLRKDKATGRRQAIATAIDPHIEVRITGTGTEWIAELSESDTAATELPEVAVAKVSGGATFQFQPRRSLPLTVV